MESAGKAGKMPVMADWPDDTLETDPNPHRPRHELDDTAEPRRRRTDHELRNAYRVLRVQFLRRCAAAGAECHFGDGRIDYSRAHGDPRAATVHHTIPVALRPDLEMATALWAPAHALCNKLGQAAFDGREAPPDTQEEVVPDTGVPSEVW